MYAATNSCKDSTAYITSISERLQNFRQFADFTDNSIQTISEITAINRQKNIDKPVPYFRVHIFTEYMFVFCLEGKWVTFLEVIFAS